jgi:hypothetical protein
VTNTAKTATKVGEGLVMHSFVQIEEMPICSLGLELSRVRCPPPARVETILRDLATNGQLTPLVARVQPEGQPQLLDGFKRLRAARALGWKTLKVGCLEAQPTTALALMLSLNRGFGLSQVLRWKPSGTDSAASLQARWHGVDGEVGGDVTA